ncbi:hypothetical protein GF339_10810 [candidate division KSB3 bacterium]|uniref:Uncharacterized protein n=1 Tax=candidate division KSB3 bacterium TaxID=2044937 RepID=A0A9D5Q6M6_9BACT|nr:hypothetical protein [candidate division KSB3 bacterium]MBD3325066.1 hypothetical protein [candidate division KSB3 bacterium]
MKNPMQYSGIVAIVIACVAILAVPALALEPSSGYYGNGNPYGYYQNGPGFRGYDWSRYPGSTEYCTKWIPDHWVAVRIMMPGRWIYRPVWIPAYPKTVYQKVKGFWQTTGYHTRPDVYVWGSHRTGWYGIPAQNCQSCNQGYFDANGMWHPSQNK